MKLFPVQNPINRIFYSVKPLFFMMLAVAVLTVPAKWILAWLVASLAHELGHYGMIHLLGKHIYEIRIGGNGVVMETDDLAGAEWVCALAGPLTGLLLVMFYRWFPRVAVCSMVQSIFNLLPVYPLDGGRIFAGLMRFVLPEKQVAWISRILSIGIVTVLVILSIGIMRLYSLRLLPLLFIICLLWKTRIIKFSCKAGRLRVQ